MLKCLHYLLLAYLPKREKKIKIKWDQDFGFHNPERGVGGKQNLKNIENENKKQDT